VKKPEFSDQTLKYIVKRMLEASDEVIRKTNDALMQLPEVFVKMAISPR